MLLFPLKNKPLPHHTDLDGEARWQAQSDEVAQFGEQGVGNGHEVDDGHHLLGEGQRVRLAQPHLGLEPAGSGKWKD